MVTFRRFRPDDLNRISMCNMDPLTETYDSSFYLQYYAKWPGMFIVAEDDSGNIVGYVMGKLESSPAYFKQSPHYLPWHAHITALTVAPAYRRSGIGGVLTKRLEEEGDVGDAWFMDLFVRKSNTRAINFYKKSGYSVYRVVKNYYGDDVNDPTADGEDAYDMRKSMKRDTKGQHVRENGEKHAKMRTKRTSLEDPNALHNVKKQSRRNTPDVIMLRRLPGWRMLKNWINAEGDIQSTHDTGITWYLLED
ncbi:hypothetical protein JX266_001575 [Neoarthrinium moseri]|nr:hypothetical protein JX266_001575 [Neoarthrinium moseri]